MSNIVFVDDDVRVVTASELYQVYDELDGNVNAVARYFGVHPMKIWRKLREFEIAIDDEEG